MKPFLTCSSLGRKRVGEAAPVSSPAGRTTSGGQLGRKRVGEAAPVSSPAGRTTSGGQLACRSPSATAAPRPAWGLPITHIFLCQIKGLLALLEVVSFCD